MSTFIKWLNSCEWPPRKLLAECTRWNLVQFASLSTPNLFLYIIITSSRSWNKYYSLQMKTMIWTPSLWLSWTAHSTIEVQSHRTVRRVNSITLRSNQLKTTLISIQLSWLNSIDLSVRDHSTAAVQRLMVSSTILYKLKEINSTLLSSCKKVPQATSSY